MWLIYTLLTITCHGVSVIFKVCGNYKLTVGQITAEDMNEIHSAFVHYVVSYRCKNVGW